MVPHHVIDADALPIQHLLEHPNHHAPLVPVSVCYNVVYAAQAACLELVVLLVDIALSPQCLSTSSRRESLTLTKPNPLPLPVLSISSDNWRRIAELESLSHHTGAKLDVSARDYVWRVHHLKVADAISIT